MNASVKQLEKILTLKLKGKISVLTAQSASGLKKILNENKNFFLIGGGSNLVVNPKTKKTAVKLGENFVFLKTTKKGVKAGAALPLSRLVSFGVGLGDTRYSRLALIPGSVGGALKGNAGSKYGFILELAEKVKILTPDTSVKILKKEEIKYGYRKTNLKGVILEAEFNINKGSVLKAKKVFKEVKDEKLKTQDYSFPSAGCVFKNPAGVSAGYLIDKAGLKGVKIGGVEVSKKHANFIINKKDGTFDDFTALAARVKKEVQKKFDKNLLFEVEVIK